MNSDNKLFLSTIAIWNFEHSKPIYEFITKRINVIFDVRELQMLTFKEYYENKKMKNRALSILK